MSEAERDALAKAAARAVAGLMPRMQPAPEDAARWLAHANPWAMLAAFEGPPMGDVRVFVAFHHSERNELLRADLVLVRPGVSSRTLTADISHPSPFTGCSMWALVTMLSHRALRARDPEIADAAQLAGAELPLLAHRGEE